jgi:hypothetical protein
MHHHVRVVLKSGRQEIFDIVRREESDHGIHFFSEDNYMTFFPYSSIDFLRIGPSRE